MRKVVLYGVGASPPVRAVLLTLQALDVPYEFKFVNLFEKEHESEEFARINPTKTVPALDDNGVLVGDSHAIMAYLASKYGKDDSLYPKDLVKRSVVDQRLHFDTGMVFERALRATTAPIFIENKTVIQKSNLDNIAAVYEKVNVCLKDQPYVAGDHLTIADFSLISSISTLQTFLVADPIKYPNLVAWMKRLEKLPYYEEANGKGLKEFKDFLTKKEFKFV